MAPVVVSCFASEPTLRVFVTPISEAGFSAALARPKSRILAWPRLVTKIFAGLMSRWTMPSAWAASSASAISMASDSINSVHRSTCNTMLQGGGSARLSPKTLQPLWVLGHTVRQELERHEASELSIFSFVDDAHAPTAQLLDDAVVRDGFADH